MSHFLASNHQQANVATYRVATRTNGSIDGAIQDIVSDAHNRVLHHDTDNRYFTPAAFRETTARRVLLNDDSGDEGGNASTVSSVSTSSSSSSTILAPRPAAPLQPTAQPVDPIAPAVVPQPAQQQRSDERRCWICFGEDDDSEGDWVRPCRCSLVSHEQCLLIWINENHKEAPSKKVRCPQCAVVYRLTERRNLSLSLMRLVDTLAHTAAPYVTFLGIGCSVLITCTTLGVHTVMTLFGRGQGEQIIGHPANWTWHMWTGLPLIPITLFLSRSRWADGILPVAAVTLLRATKDRQQSLWPPSPAVAIGMLPWLRLLYNNLYLLAQHYVSQRLAVSQRQQQQPRQRQNGNATGAQRAAGNDAEEGEGRPTNGRRRTERQRNISINVREGRDGNTMLLGALLWPTISSLVGSCLYNFKMVRKYFPEPFQRNLLGGCLFIVAKDIASLFYKYERIRQSQSRRIKNYNEGNI